MQRKFIKHASGAKTAIYLHQIVRPDAKIAVLVHGYGGNYFGMTWLAEALEASDWSTIIVEMPSHGCSSLQEITSREELEAWFEEVLRRLRQKYGHISAVIAHSFGCYAVSSATTCQALPVVLINPVYAPSASYFKMAKMSLDSSAMTLLQNLAVLSPLKGLYLLQVFNRKSLLHISQNVCHCQPTWSQKLRQRHMLKIILDGYDFSASEGKIHLIISGQFDNINRRLSQAKLRQLFGKTPIHELPSGHLLPFELPDQLAELITSALN